MIWKTREARSKAKPRKRKIYSLHDPVLSFTCNNRIRIVRYIAPTVTIFCTFYQTVLVLFFLFPFERKARKEKTRLIRCVDCLLIMCKLRALCFAIASLQDLQLLSQLHIIYYMMEACTRMNVLWDKVYGTQCSWVVS